MVNNAKGQITLGNKKLPEDSEVPSHIAFSISGKMADQCKMIYLPARHFE